MTGKTALRCLQWLQPGLGGGKDMAGWVVNRESSERKVRHRQRGQAASRGRIFPHLTRRTKQEFDTVVTAERPDGFGEFYLVHAKFESRVLQ